VTVPLPVASEREPTGNIRAKRENLCPKKEFTEVRNHPRQVRLRQHVRYPLHAQGRTGSRDLLRLPPVLHRKQKLVDTAGRVERFRRKLPKPTPVKLRRSQGRRDQDRRSQITATVTHARAPPARAFHLTAKLDVDEEALHPRAEEVGLAATHAMPEHSRVPPVSPSAMCTSLQPQSSPRCLASPTPSSAVSSRTPASFLQLRLPRKILSFVAQKICHSVAQRRNLLLSAAKSRHHTNQQSGCGSS